MLRPYKGSITYIKKVQSVSLADTGFYISPNNSRKGEMKKMSSKIFDDFKKCSMTSRNLSTLSGTWKTTASGSPEIPRKELQVIPLDGPMFVADAVAKYGVDHDTAHDTAVNDLHGGYGTNLMVQYQGTTWCLRDTGRATLYTTAGLIGPANANMVKAEGFCRPCAVLEYRSAVCQRETGFSCCVMANCPRCTAAHPTVTPLCASAGWSVSRRRS